MFGANKIYVVAALIISSFLIIVQSQYTKTTQNVRQHYPIYRRGETVKPTTTRRYPINKYNYRRSFYPSNGMLPQNTPLQKANGIESRQMHLTSNQHQFRSGTSVAKFRNTVPQRKTQTVTSRRNTNRPQHQRYGNRGYPRRQGNQFGFFNLPQNYNRYNLQNSGTQQQPTFTQQISDNPYSPISYNNKQQGWYSVSSSGSPSRPIISGRNKYRVSTSSNNQHIIPSGFQVQSQGSNFNNANLRNNQNQLTISNTYPSRPLNQNFDNGGQQRIKNHPLKFNNSNGITKSQNNFSNQAQFKTVESLDASSETVTTKPSIIRITPSTLTTSTTSSSATTSLRNTTLVLDSDSQLNLNKGTFKNKSNENGSMSSQNANKHPIEDKNIPSISVWAREPTPSLFDAEDKDTIGTSRVPLPIFDDTKVYQDRYISTSSLPLVPPQSTTESSIEKATTVKLDPRLSDEYKLFMEWLENNREEKDDITVTTEKENINNSQNFTDTVSLISAKINTENYDDNDTVQFEHLVTENSRDQEVIFTQEETLKEQNNNDESFHLSNIKQPGLVGSIVGNNSSWKIFNNITFDQEDAKEITSLKNKTSLNDGEKTTNASQGVTEIIQTTNEGEDKNFISENIGEVDNQAITTDVPPYNPTTKGVVDDYAIYDDYGKDCCTAFNHQFESYVFL